MGPPVRHFMVQRSLRLGPAGDNFKTQIWRDVQAMSWAAHLATTSTNGLATLDCDVLEDVLGSSLRANKYVVGALHAVTNSFGRRVGKDAGARRFGDEVRSALNVPHLRVLQDEVSSLHCSPIRLLPAH